MPASLSLEATGQSAWAASAKAGGGVRIPAAVDHGVSRAGTSVVRKRSRPAWWASGVLLEPVLFVAGHPDPDGEPRPFRLQEDRWAGEHLTRRQGEGGMRLLGLPRPRQGAVRSFPSTGRGFGEIRRSAHLVAIRRYT
ncbi:hypothetical protein NOSIN_15780 [Nocardiopsis sinuspersici]|uniref:Uncharacterized protein n=1 Tax=Nocardiopsis sinuspersici TaxID=501010 RepID=A0A1V3C2W7_9ACTN|nr:hypothetical protein NOSIN_15780 [Nocardiopsis sinuspersici]